MRGGGTLRPAHAEGASGGAGQKGRWGQSPEERLQSAVWFGGFSAFTGALGHAACELHPAKGTRTGRDGRCADSALAAHVGDPAAGVSGDARRVPGSCSRGPGGRAGPRLMSPKPGRRPVPGRACGDGGETGLALALGSFVA